MLLSGRSAGLQRPGDGVEPESLGDRPLVRSAAAGEAMDLTRKSSGIFVLCRYCLRLSDSEVCRECMDHEQTSGHFPNEVSWQRVPGQPRMISRVCGRCGIALRLSSGE